MQAHAANLPPTPTIDRMTDVPVEILQFAADAFEAGLGSALVTLVEIRGGAARALGSQMSVAGDGRYRGYVSGGCTEAAVAAEALVAIDNRRDRFLLLGDGSPFFDISLPCGGGITLAIHVLRESRQIRSAVSSLEARKRTALSYDPGQQKLETVAFDPPSGWRGDRFVRSFRPAAKVVISGRGIEMAAAEALSKAVGYETVCIEPGDKSAWNEVSIDRDTAVVLLHHDLDLELPALRAALDASPFYVGALGSRRTHERRRDRLLELGYDEAAIDRIKAPIGLFDKARDASTLAMSALGDVAVAYGASGMPATSPRESGNASGEAPIELPDLAHLVV